MPNGGADNCGECAFNPRSLSRATDLRMDEAGWCDIRAIAVPRPFSTYCANFHTRSRSPEGPVFAGFHEFGRLPWHGDNEVLRSESVDGPCELCADATCRLSVDGPTGRSFFCGPEDYLAWWQAQHPGERGEYPWHLHDSMADDRRRARGRDAPKGVRECLRSWLRR